MTPEGDLILERVIGGEEIDDEQMGELLNLFQDYDSGKYDPGYISELALNRFADILLPTRMSSARCA